MKFCRVISIAMIGAIAVVSCRDVTLTSFSGSGLSATNVNPNPACEPAGSVGCNPQPSPTEFSPIQSGAIVISSVAGSLAHGSTLMISGSGFGAKSAAAPLIWEDFEWGNNGDSIGDNYGWIRSDQTYYPTITSLEKYGPGGRSGYGQMWQSDNEQTEFQTANRKFSESDTVYVSYMTRWDYDSSDCCGWKLLRLGPATGCYAGSPKLGISYQTSGSGWIYAYNDDGTTWLEDTMQTKPPRRTWFRVEMYIKLSNPSGAANGKVNIRINNITQNLDPGETDDITRASGNANRLGCVTLPFMWVNNTVWYDKTYVWADDIYLDNTQTRVEICDSRTWSARTHCEIQIPATWSATSVGVTLNQGAFNSLSGAYLYVIDANGNMNEAGYPLK